MSVKLLNISIELTVYIFIIILNFSFIKLNEIVVDLSLKLFSNPIDKEGYINSAEMTILLVRNISTVPANMFLDI